MCVLVSELGGWRMEREIVGNASVERLFSELDSASLTAKLRYIRREREGERDNLRVKQG